MAKLFANSGDPDQMLRVLRRLIWVCTVCQLPFYGSPNYSGLILNKSIYYLLMCLPKEYQTDIFPHPPGTPSTSIHVLESYKPIAVSL